MDISDRKCGTCNKRAWSLGVHDYDILVHGVCDCDRTGARKSRL